MIILKNSNLFLSLILLESPCQCLFQCIISICTKMSSQLIFHTSKKSNDFVAYMRGLLNKVNRIKNSSVSREFLDEVVGTNKVLMFFFRFDEDFWSVKKVERAFFILEDNLNRDLEGTIIIRRRITGEGEYSLREIANFLVVSANRLTFWTGTGFSPMLPNNRKEVKTNQISPNRNRSHRRFKPYRPVQTT